MGNEQKQITPEELDEAADCAARGEELRSTRVESRYRRAAATIRTLQAKLAEAEKRAVPEGTCEVTWFSARKAFGVNEHTESRWFWSISRERNLLATGYAETLADAALAAEKAAERAETDE